MVSEKIDPLGEQHRKVFAIGDLVSHFIYKDQLYIVKSIEDNGDVRLYSVKQMTSDEWVTNPKVLDFVE